MKICSFVIVALICLALLEAPLLAQKKKRGEYPSPDKWDKKIKAFETMDKKSPPPEGAIVCVGSSSMRMWHKTIHNDLAPLTLVPRGFGGSNMNDALYYADRIVLNYKPRAILLYECDNDINQGVPHEKILATFHAFVAKVHGSIPECRIYVIAVKPSIARWKIWPEMDAMNKLLAISCEKDKRLTFIDIASPMLTEQGKPREDIFVKDRHHLSREGYDIWRDTIKPILHMGELAHEKHATP